MIKKSIKKEKTDKAKPKKSKSGAQYKIEISILKKAPEDKEFVLVDGRKIRDVKELAFALGEMGDNIFWHHVNDARNDFVSWINDVFDDKELAESLKNARDRVNAQITILKHIVNKIK
jgi:hypothetical protein